MTQLTSVPWLASSLHLLCYQGTTSTSNSSSILSTCRLSLLPAVRTTTSRSSRNCSSSSSQLTNLPRIPTKPISTTSTHILRAKANMGYDRNETVAAITSFYEFLTQVHLDDNAIRHPPPDEGGWPHLTDDYLSVMEKNPTVNDLIRHIPYIRYDGGEQPVIYYETAVNDLAGEYFRRYPNRFNFDPQADLGLCTVPSHVLTLASCCSRDGFYYMLDTERGTMTACDFQYGPESTELSEDVDFEDEENWRGHATYRIGDFFEMLKEDYRSFKVVAIGESEVKLTEGLEEGQLEELKNVFREHGFLTANYRKSECLKKASDVWMSFSGDSSDNDDDE